MGIDYQRMMDNPEDFVDYLDSKFDSLVQGLIEDAGKEYSYRVEDLDQMVNESETLREYIRDSEQTFRLPRKDLDKMSSVTLTNYVKQLDKLWEV
jgi:hypothetical protein